MGNGECDSRCGSRGSRASKARTTQLEGPLDRANKYQLDEIYATIENPSILSGDDWRVGARVDFVYGTTYRFLTSAGLESSWNTGRSYGLAMPNAYAEVQLGAVDTKLGHFTSPVGYCAIGAANNFFAVLPYTFQYGEPFTHTGFLSSTKLGGGWSAGAGLTDGWDSTANWSSESRGFGSDAWNRHVGGLGTLSKSEVFDAHDSLDCVFVSSEEPDSTGIGRTPRYLQTVVYSREVASDWTWIVQSDFGTQRAAIVSPTGSSSAQWYGLNQFLFWQVAPQWRLGANVEWFRDEDGFRVGGAVPSYGSPSGGSFRRGLFQGNFFRLMVGPKWTPSANVIVRPAIAFDRYEGPGVAGLRPFDDGTSDHQWLAVLDVILRF
ncbi:MAG: outer membrane beta-barrel protein [Planctomycetes bacterium]|nr:outer membrane beta-barrel protein [Planctomycetota bacterium]